MMGGLTEDSIWIYPTHGLCQQCGLLFTINCHCQQFGSMQPIVTANNLDLSYPLTLPTIWIYPTHCKQSGSIQPTANNLDLSHPLPMPTIWIYPIHCHANNLDLFHSLSLQKKKKEIFPTNCHCQHFGSFRPTVIAINLNFSHPLTWSTI